MNDKEFHNFISVTQENICQITALKNGIVLINDTWHNYKTTDTVHVMSATKSVVSLLIGIAVDKGFIKSINQPVLNFFPDYTIKRGEKTIQQVTLRHLLTMTAPYKYRSEPWTKVCSSDDWTVAALDLLGRQGRTYRAVQVFYTGHPYSDRDHYKSIGAVNGGFCESISFYPAGDCAAHKLLCRDGRGITRHLPCQRNPTATSGLRTPRASLRQVTAFACLRRRWRRSARCVLSAECMEEAASFHLNG